MIEILAPAGDEQSAYAAINAGADAIYLGLTAFSARSSAANFGYESLERLIAYAHLFGVKIYVAMNTLVKEEELEEFIKNAVAVHNLGADALIIQDIYLGAYLKRTYPDMCLHLSTQAGVCNTYGARFAKEVGFSRVILARETRIEDIRSITGIIETEVFVQGALCTSFSGQCYLSGFAGGNSGNRGRCKQPCRKRYSIDREGFEDYAYRISLSDLSLGEDIKILAQAGVSSFKIEGRMRRPEYVSAAVGYYKMILAEEETKAAFSALKRTYNRGNYTKGMAFGQEKCFISSSVQGHIGEYIGTVQVMGGRYFCRTQANCGEGDGFKILRDGNEVCGAVYEDGAKGGIYIKSSVRLKNGDKVFITTDASLNAELLEKKRAYKIEISASISVGQAPIVSVNGHTFKADFTAEEAKGIPFTEADFKTCFNKVDKYPFNVCYGTIETDGNAFVPLSKLNAFRRDVYAGFYKTAARSGNVKIDKIASRPKPAEPCYANRKTCVISRDLRGVKADIGVLKPDDYFADLSALLSGFKGEKYLYLPPYITDEEIGGLKPVIMQFNGIYCGGYYAKALAEELKIKLFAGTGFNIFNSLSLSFCTAHYIALSKELTAAEAKPLSRQNTFYLTEGDVQVMDLIYCPFSATCKTCDRRDIYVMCDEDKRRFPLRRYKLKGNCRFEVFNCATLAATNNFTGVLKENTTNIITQNKTKGHSEKPVL